MRKLLEKILRVFRSIKTKRNTGLEAKRRRQLTRTSISGIIDRVWNAHYEPPRVEQLLRKYTLRTRKDQELREAEGKRSERNALIKRLSDYEGYRRIIVPFLQVAENDAYMKLRHPEDRKQGEFNKEISLEEYVGRQNGKLELIEDMRLMVSSALADIQRDLDKKKAEAIRKGEQNAETNE